MFKCPECQKEMTYLGYSSNLIHDLHMFECKDCHIDVTKEIQLSTVIDRSGTIH